MIMTFLLMCRSVCFTITLFTIEPEMTVKEENRVQPGALPGHLFITLVFIFFFLVTLHTDFKSSLI